MSDWGGKRDGSGRPRGSSNPNTKARRAAIKVVVANFEATTPDAFVGDAVALMQLIYRDPKQDIGLRLDAAKAASRFERPALQATLTRDVTPQATTPNGIDSAIEALMRKARGYVDVDGSGSAAGAGELAHDGQATTSDPAAGT
jgi:hypothetical protein